MHTLPVQLSLHNMHITKKDRNKDKNLKKRKQCRDAAHWQTKHRNKLHVGMLLTGLQNTNNLHVGCDHKNQCDETILNNPWPYISEPDTNPLHQWLVVSDWVAYPIASLTTGRASESILKLSG